jgi:DNA-binding transcriptional MerR regulator
MSRIPQTGLTIGAVAARTGVSVPVLRSWEQRYGFPHPERLPGGHRRYHEADVDRILRVVAERQSGRSLEAAVAAVTAGPASAAGSPTVFAGLRRLHPELPTQVIGRRTMLAVSLAIEDECLARAEHPHLAAAFQREEVFRLAQHRWEGLARTAAATLVFADFSRSRRAGSIHEVAIPEVAPLRREWSVVCDAPESAAVLAGWERPDGRFEALWSVDPEVVRAATVAARDLATQLAPRLRLPDPPHAAPWAWDPHRSVDAATSLTNRIVAYLDALPPRR